MFTAWSAGTTRHPVSRTKQVSLLKHPLTPGAQQLQQHPITPGPRRHTLRCMTRDKHDCTLVMTQDELLLLDPAMTYSRPLCKLPPSRDIADDHQMAANEAIMAAHESSWLDEARGLFFVVSVAMAPLVLRVM